MTDVARVAEMRVTPAQLEPILALYDQGLYLQAYHRALGIGPLWAWRGTSIR